jgi:hypothetical protein
MSASGTTSGSSSGGSVSFGTPLYGNASGGTGSSSGGLGGGGGGGRSSGSFGGTGGFSGTSSGSGRTSGGGGSSSTGGFGSMTGGGVFGGTSGGSSGVFGGTSGGRSGTTGFGGTSGGLGGTSGGFGGTAGARSGSSSSNLTYAGANFGPSNGVRSPRMVTTLQFRGPATAASAPAVRRDDLQQVFTRSTAFIAPGGVNVALDGQVIVLRGRVANDDEKRLAENMLRLTPGVRQVRNELEVPATTAGGNQ